MSGSLLPLAPASRIPAGQSLPEPQQRVASPRPSLVDSPFFSVRKDMTAPSAFADYQVGQVVTLSVTSRHGEAEPSSVGVRVRQLHHPRTLSCCMLVDVPEDGYGHDPVFLKLYDRRWSEQFRRDYGAEPWSKSVEEQFVAAVRTGAARELLHSLHTVPNFEEDTMETWDVGQDETFLTEQMRRLCETETSIYDRLRDIQGKMVPRLVERVSLVLSLPDDAGISAADAEELFSVHGILLQYVDGFSLSRVQEHAPRSHWQKIVDRAIAVVQVIGDHDILNRDVRPDNFIVCRDEDGDEYRVFMIDFGLARVRRPDESDRDWAKAKLTKDEEGAVGLVMKKRLAREGFELRFENSDRYMEYAGGDDE
ncbi:hypothetical protein VTK73DRAFT_2272 [Phialemonium thermophilum]|uniref:Protein kinase domain-containing protein n=1 Tax=Phialemonium thermophilum TaxID=223376 RepID=A0ABR3VSE1_9PEZI